MKRLLSFAALGFTIAAAPALADNAIIARCTGNGAFFYLSEFSEDLIRDAMSANYDLGPAPSPGSILVLREGKAPYWDPRSRADIDRDCGGDGDDDLALFDGIQPRSGLWQARLGETRLEGCPAVMQQLLPGSTGALPAEWTQPRRLKFKVPFHPDQLPLTRSLSADGRSLVIWRNAGDDAWQTEVFPELFGQIPAGLDRGSKMTWRLTVRSESEIDHVSTVHIALPAEAAAVMGSASDCRFYSANSWVRVGD
ncbi:hypothetical protein [Microbaculum marinisediminis]|uniref:Uncharacterized protein n=1 Tax=Microbaculum marinisediminis TaxID=2931392 RepID=A0AAW5R118_9HYPH|nr:hypothetical protein [Microbaculum sp. A6E488]MCT8973509.1 hypothetical protein [Microbaculum sp. A6E488]